MKISFSHGIRCWLVGVFSAPFLGALIFICTAWIWLPQLGNWLMLPSQTEKADVIVVLAGGGPERMMKGIELYKQGLAPELWYTGDVPFDEMSSFTDGELARRFALDQGVPASALRLLSTSSTWEDGQQIAAALRQVGASRLLLVTSWYHSRRAMCVLHWHLQGTQVVVFYNGPALHTAGPDNWWQNEEGLVSVVNEWFKFGLYWVKYGLKPWDC